MIDQFINMQDYYNLGDKALEAGDYKLAAAYFKRCSEIYYEAELPLYSKEIHFIGTSSYAKYKEIERNNFGPTKGKDQEK